MLSALRALQYLTVGGLIILLPFFCNPWGGEMYFQFEAPKLFAAFLLGNLCFAVFIWRVIHPAMAFAHLTFAFLVLITGFGGGQLYPFSYWCAGMFLVTYALQAQPYYWNSYLQCHYASWIWHCLVFGACLCALQAYLQMFGFSWPLQYAPGIESGRPIAMLGQQTKLGAFLAPMAAAAFGLGWVWPCAFISIVVLATKSSFSIFALVIGLMTVAVGKGLLRRRRLLLVLMGGLFLVVIGPRFGDAIPALSDHGRGFAYRDTIAAIVQRPIFGYGPGSFQAIFHQFHQSPITRGMGGGDYIQAHNDYLQVVYEGGLVGGFAMLVLVVSILCAYRTIWIWQREFVDFRSLAPPTLCSMGALAALMVNAVGNFPFTMSPHYLIGMLSAGFLLRAARA